MRAGLSTIHQTLTPEAANVLNHSIAEATRRIHGQTTPLHVAATLLASPSGFLRQACIRSHPNSSHPLQCRALELCFSVALDRLPTAQNMAVGTEPPISNALMAALKRSQAHQRRGCPEQQQQPLLAVKVELEQLIISILDDPSVSRVMREASFSSPAVKAIIEQQQSMNSQSSTTTRTTINSTPIGRMFRQTPIPSPVLPNGNRNLYMNPLLQQGNPLQQRTEEVKKVIDIMVRSKKRNPILVGESEPGSVMKEVIRRIEKGEVTEASLKNAQVMVLRKEKTISEFGDEIEARLIKGGLGTSIVIDLCDLKWLVEQPMVRVVCETGRTAVVEMGKILSRFPERVWLIGTASCETYLRCQVYHPSMENDWDLQALPITARSPHSVHGMFQRSAGNIGILNRSIESINPPLKTAESSSSDNMNSEAARSRLPQWLQCAKTDNIPTRVQKNYGLGLYNPNLQPKAVSPVRTNLALGQTENLEKTTQTEQIKDFLSCISSEPAPIVKIHELQAEKFSKAADTDTFKKLLKGLTEKAWWQPEAASSLATAITRCRMGNGKKRGSSSKGDIWLLFTGPDKVSKRKMASVVADQVCGSSLVVLSLGSRRDGDLTRGKTALNRIAEAVRMDPFSVIMLEDVDEADMVIRGSIKRAMERGRLTDSHGREISLGNVVFILTVKADNMRNVVDHDESRFSSLAGGNWQLKLSVAEKRFKRRASWLDGMGNPKKQTGVSHGVSFDLNLLADGEDDRTDGSYNSSDVTIEHETETGVETRQFIITSVPRELAVHVDDTIVFKPMEFEMIRREIKTTIVEKFSDAIFEKNVTIEVEDSALEKVLGGIWLGGASLNEWAEKVLCPSFEKLRPRMSFLGKSEEAWVVRLELDGDDDSGERRSNRDWLPEEIAVAADV
ncbi:protein SUPPRESSOR OF MAX2 1-like [Impatiens glandulifera]|uniref:protein SUPPRESSOR OF MAX2 1-like n=1 Tax=Impatiens glandulifera TaxID=253017 RepID=UPI001FB0F08A|nr:protein SUPPRESSOR OF MAX2 1-like [Impatiens glandulifera]